MSVTWKDYTRQLLNLLGAPAMWVLSSLSFFMPSVRTASDFSDMSDNLLVPFGAAFSIWFPIFVGCIAYGIYQALGSNRTRDVFRKTGWWTAAGFWLICGWALIVAFAPAGYVQWGTALIFIPAMLCLVKAMLIFSHANGAFDKLESWMVVVPVSLIAGWTSLAVFLNWTPIAYDFAVSAFSQTTISLAVLTLALIWAITNLRRSYGNKVYAFPIIWGLSFLAIRHLAQSENIMIGIAAILGAILVIVFTVWQTRQTTYQTLNSV